MMNNIDKIIDEDNKNIKNLSYQILDNNDIQSIEIKWYNKGKLDRSLENGPAHIIISEKVDIEYCYMDYEFYYKNNILQKMDTYHYF